MEYLAHYGVKGMKWGVRKDKPSTGNKRRKASRASESSNSKKGLTDIQKKRLKTAAIVGVAAVGIGLAVYGGVKYKNLSAAKKAIQLGEELVRDRQQLQKIIPDLRKVNKRDVVKYKDWETKALEKISWGAPNRGHNCVLCSTAYDLRRRGINVTANPLFGGLSADNIKTLYPNAKPIAFVSQSAKMRGDLANKLTDIAGTGRLPTYMNVSDKTLKSVSPMKSAFSAMSQMGDGARGTIFAQMKNAPMAHSMAFEVINGKPYILDGQSGKIYKSFDQFAKVWDNSNLMVTRLDNVAPDLRAMRVNDWIRFIE